MDPKSSKTQAAPAHRRPEPFYFHPFALQSCTVLSEPTADDQAAYDAYVRSCDSAERFWAGAPASDWMLDVLRKGWDRFPASIETALRRFALECVRGLRSGGAPSVQELLDVGQRYLDGSATLDDLRQARASAHGQVSAGGVHGLPRCSAYAAAVLAAWHALDPDAGAAANWSAEFAARHDAFVVLQERGRQWHWAEDQGEHWRDSWRAAFFAKAHPEVEAAATAEARRRQADFLRSILPSPHGPPVRGEVYFGPVDERGNNPVYCTTCGAQRGDTTPGVSFDVRGMLCKAWRTPVARCVH